ncbi:MAG: hypothetical protein K2K26_09575, partial [Muribaculaceae bacterium]|nr:hypothetical protein [Muribaculaceae bacterium]
MGAFLDYIFNNNHYKEVQQAYDLVHNTSLQTAFGVWKKHYGLFIGKTYADKEHIFEHIEEIKSIDNWIKTTHKLISNMHKGVEWLYSVKRGVSSIPVLHYKEYEFIAANESTVKTFDRYHKTYNRLISSCREAILWLYYDSFGVTEIPSCNYKEIEFIATNEPKIKKFHDQLNEFNRISKSYPEACERLVNKKLAIISFIDKKKIANSETKIKEIDEELKRVKKLRSTYPLA